MQTRYWSLLTAVGLLFALAACDSPTSSQEAAPELAKGGFYGHITRNAVRMDIKDYYQSWDAEANKLLLVFTPTPLTEADRAVMDKNKHYPIGAVAAYPSPDPQRWKDWYPLVIMELFFAGPEVSLDTLVHYQVIASRLELPEYTENFGGMPDEAIRIDQLDFVQGQLVGLHFTGSKSFYPDSPYAAQLQWQIIVH